MKLTLSGHDYKYAVEQILLMMYPDEVPEYAPPACGGLSANVRLTLGRGYAAATTRISADGKVYTGMSHVRRDALDGKLATDRLLQKIIKRSFYLAAVQHTGLGSVWGALTGIRPGKLATDLLEHGNSEASAKKKLEREYFVSPERAALCLDTAKASLAVKQTLGNRDIALYIGIPFCPTRCHYCSFVSHSVEKSMKLIAPFLTALEEEIGILSRAVRVNGLNVISVYIGGGTPTTLSAEELSRLMGALDASFDLKNVREYTVEAGRPDTVTDEKFRVLRQNGATRVSVNPQSMSDNVLSAIGRRHTAADIVAAYAEAHRAGFGVVNMDLIAGLPADTPEGFGKSLEEVLRWSRKISRSIRFPERKARQSRWISRSCRTPPPSPKCSIRQAARCGMQGMRRIICTGKNSCPAVSKMSDGAVPARKVCTISSLWKSLPRSSRSVAAA
jgi:oxygen-independent coproporphyrinogen-3 oxidase